MMIIKKLIIGIISVCAAGLAVAQKNVIDEVIWVVGDEAILLSDVESQRLYMQNMRIRFEGDPYCFIPEQLAVQKLFLSQAKIDSIYADEGNVLRAVDRWVNNAINEVGSKEKLEEYYGGKKLSMIKEERKKTVRDQNVAEEMQRKIVGDIKLTPSDVRKYFSQISKDSLPMIPSTVEVEIIAMEPKIPLDDIDAIKARLRGFTEQINKGEYQFSTLAQLYSEDPGTYLHGGEMGFVSKIELSQEFANVAFNLNDPTRVSNIVETEYGYHIIQLIEKRGDRINVRHILLRPKVSEPEIVKAIGRLDTLYRDIKDEKLTFEEAATFFSSDKDTRNNKGLMVNKNMESNNFSTPKFEMEELPLGMGVIVDKMEVGEISTPFRMKNAAQKDIVAIVKLKSRVKAHQANVSDDYQALKSLVEERKRNEIINNWIVSKQKSTFIRISEGWKECDFKYGGWIKE
ncbi:MAG: peptidylprolyl isomerase [Tannerella sp.]|jgi:peptidyl-prolyl cis-trans isomerase SurA|nr:peptidylprolyl isomerase [Tannerella sp.]